MTFENPDGAESFEYPEDAHVLGVAGEEGLELPHSCRAESWSSCAGGVRGEGTDQSGQAFFEDDQMGDGVCITCMTYVTLGVTVKLEQPNTASGIG